MIAAPVIDDIFDNRFENDGIPAQISDEAADILADLFLALAEAESSEGNEH